MQKKLIALAAVALLSSACHRTQLPQGVMNHQQMVRFLTEAALVENYYGVATDFGYDSTALEAFDCYNQILTSQNLTAEQVQRSMQYYQKNLAQYAKIQDEVMQAIDTLRSR